LTVVILIINNKPRDFTRLIQHFFFLEKRKPVLKEKNRMFLVKVFTKDKKVVGNAFLSKKRFLV